MWGTWLIAVTSIAGAVLLVVAFALAAWTPLFAVAIAVLVVPLLIAGMAARRRESDPSSPSEARERSEAALENGAPQPQSRQARGAPVSGEG